MEIACGTFAVQPQVCETTGPLRSRKSDCIGVCAGVAKDEPGLPGSTKIRFRASLFGQHKVRASWFNHNQVQGLGLGLRVLGFVQGIVNPPPSDPP